MNAQQLIDFEKSIADAFDRGEIRCPVHLSGGNESQLIEIFKQIDKYDYIFSSHRHNYHALLHSVPEDFIRSEIMAGRGMNLMCHERKFFTSAIVGGILPIAVGVADGLKRNGSNQHVWCFVGDMCANMGLFHESTKYAENYELPITFIIEDNGLSTDTPTDECWGVKTALLKSLVKKNGITKITKISKLIYYWYRRTWPHVCTGKYVRL